VTLEYCTRLLDVGLYAKTRTRGGLLLSCVATLGYCVKQLGSWILGAVKASVLCTARALP